MQLPKANQLKLQGMIGCMDMHNLQGKGDTCVALQQGHNRGAHQQPVLHRQ
jgi:hypothetical protein